MSSVGEYLSEISRSENIISRYEELLMKEEGMQETANKLIHIGKPIEMDDDKFREQLSRLEKASKAEVSNMKDIVAEMVPTYKRKVEV